MTQLAGPPGSDPTSLPPPDQSGTDTPEDKENPSSEATPPTITKSVTFAWEPSTSEGVLGYKVYLFEESTAKRRIIDVGFKTELAIALHVGEAYGFTVTAYNASGESPWPPFVYFSIS